MSDFSVAGSDKIGNFSITNLETSADTTDLISAGDATTIATTTTIAVTKVSGNFDLGTAGTGNILTLSSATAFTNTSVADALESGGSLQLTANGAIADGDGFMSSTMTTLTLHCHQSQRQPFPAILYSALPPLG